VNVVDEILSDRRFAGLAQPKDRNGQVICAGCGQGQREHVSDLRAWPPEQFFALRYCGGCRLARAIKGVQ